MSAGPNENTGIPRATQPQPEASDTTQMRQTAVYPGSSIHSHPFTQPPISTANENSALPLGLELCKFPGLYKPAVPDPRQDLTARPFRVNNSGSNLSSPPHWQPYTKPFSGRSARAIYDLSYTRGWGSSEREVWDCVSTAAARPTPRHQRRHRRCPTRSSCCWTPKPCPPTVVEIGTTSQPQTAFNKETRF